MFKAGDLVRIKTWNKMVKEYGLDIDGDIPCRCIFVSGMKPFCGKIYKISATYNDGLIRLKGEYGYSFSVDMIEKATINFK